MAGYSATPLAKKLGIKPGCSMRIINAPEYYFDLFSDMPDAIQVLTETKSKKNFIHVFIKQIDELEKDIVKLKNEIEKDGMIWVSWYKKSAKMNTDITEDDIRSYALKHQLVDVKVCAVSDIWSGLKLVMPLAMRSKK